MITISVADNNLNERKYIIDILFNEFLGLDYRLEVGSIDYEIVLENGNQLIIKDGFFSKSPKEMAYLNLENLPSKVDFVKNDFTAEENIPVVFGTDSLGVADDGMTTITCGIDIFASSFFMLTRWEEYVNLNRDSHNRFPAYESVAYKNNFLDRPVVNEYVELLWNMLTRLGVNQQRKLRSFQTVLTHDVDIPLKYSSFMSGFKEVLGDVVKRKNIPLAMKNLTKKTKVSLSLETDPFDTFDFLMSVSEKLEVKSHFFFMGNGVTKFDNVYNSNDPFIKKLVVKIKKRGHFIGIHPTYNAYNNQQQFRKEKEALEKNFDTEILFGREHYLRFEVPATWQVWEDNGMLWDSTVGFADKEGFRCGTCYPYSVFNILSREKLQLKERPLIVMEGNFTTYQDHIKPEEMEHKINVLINKVKKYDGEFVFLWHNSSFNTPQWERYQSVYEKVLT